VTANFREWERQQLRTCVGVLSGYERFFPGSSEFLEKFREWAYTCNRKSLRRAHASSLQGYLFYAIYIYLKMRIARKARQAIHSNAAVDWGCAISTKLFR
jgi:hypothetical protein